jgi:hypothetical protein
VSVRVLKTKGLCEKHLALEQVVMPFTCSITFFFKCERKSSHRGKHEMTTWNFKEQKPIHISWEG